MPSFGDAFKAARAAGKTTFKFGGKSYHTKTKDEMAKTKKAVPTPTPRPEKQGPNKPAAAASSAPKPKQDYPRPAAAVGIARAGSAISNAAARQENAPVAKVPSRANANGNTVQKPQTPPRGTVAKPETQGPKPEEQQWFARKGSAISLGIARRRNAPSR
ncbi:hypothetical protein SAMN02927900_04764 [Rhizobium mongolense subsp. loessense]|uniref:Uncharacterized protein n=1 Tax=Rhizobium mongolense subsp. loessense TaxID=158890 RepID=A0A1G4T6K8_9HYPH|nr:hypothetical protein [Rhizobium mongolense]SCW77084.1 hypothetical protein SAMN02927900_04764 [Rhizobium mongolense subsp. loessense]